MKLAGVVIIIISSFCVGLCLSDNLKTRLRNVAALIRFVDHVSINIQMYKTPLEEIFSTFSDKHLDTTDFSEYLNDGVYRAAQKSNLISGDEEAEIIRDFDEKIGSGTVGEMEKLCAFTVNRLRNLEEKLHREFPGKQKVYRTISVLAGISVVIMLI